jgi:hypothetical protein
MQRNSAGSRHVCGDFRSRRERGPVRRARAARLSAHPRCVRLRTRLRAATTSSSLVEHGLLRVCRPPAEEACPLRCRRHAHGAAPGKVFASRRSCARPLKRPPLPQKVTTTMFETLQQLRKKMVIGFVGGSDLVKITEQLSLTGGPGAHLHSANSVSAGRLMSSLASSRRL